MKRLWVLLFFAAAACSSPEKPAHHDHGTPSMKDHATSAAPVPDKKWKADQSTKEHVAELARIMDKDVYADAAKRQELYDALDKTVNSLIAQCTMQGPDHDALHVWLERVLEDMKVLNAGEKEYADIHAELKTDISRFYETFE